METWQLFALFALILLSPRINDETADRLADVCIIVALIHLTIYFIIHILK